MLTFKIDNKEFENELLEFLKMQKKTVEDITVDAIKKFIDSSLKKENKLVYTIKDSLKHLHKVSHEYDEELCNEVALTHIKDSASYIHNLRRQKNI